MHVTAEGGFLARVLSIVEHLEVIVLHSVLTVRNGGLIALCPQIDLGGRDAAPLAVLEVAHWEVVGVLGLG